MSDFDDEPTVGDETRAKAEPNAASASAPNDGWDDEWDDDGDRAGKRDLTLVYAVVAAAIVIVLAIVLTRPTDDGDPTSTTAPSGPKTEEQAQPDKVWQGPVGADAPEAPARSETEPGVYIWTDFCGFHVRSNLDEEVVVTVEAAKVVELKTADCEDGDETEVAAPPSRAVATVAANDADGVGFDLRESEEVTFTVTVAGQNLPKEQIFLGGGQGIADGNPVKLIKAA